MTPSLISQPPPPTPPPNSPQPSRLQSTATTLATLLLLAIAQLTLAGYQLGVGNQGIQIAFLRHFANPALYANDPMVAQTIHAYPSYFFQTLALLIQNHDLAQPYLALHLLTSFAFLASVYSLSLAIFKNRASALIAPLLLLAGQLHALAGEDLYSIGFTHTYAVLPLALFSLAFLYKGKLYPAFILAGLAFNLHALTAAYLSTFLFATLIIHHRRIGLIQSLTLLLILLITASPTLYQLAHPPNHAPFNQAWQNITYDRSSEHVQPSSWWTVGDPSLPRFALLLAVAAVYSAFAPSHSRRKTTRAIIAATSLLFLIGALFAEPKLKPLSIILRAQLFRSSRLILILALIYLAHGLASATSLFHKSRTPQSTLELLTALLTFLTIALPPLINLLPLVLLLATLTALINARLSLPAAVLAALALLTTLAARDIAFPIPGLTNNLSQSLLTPWPHGSPLAATSIFVALTLWTLLSLRPHYWKAAASLAASLLALLIAWPQWSRPNPADPWIAIQLDARDHTPQSALFLTPPQTEGFRVYSQRSVVAEWRDGTQAFFNAQYAQFWWKQIQTLDPSTPSFLESLNDTDLIDLARSLHADYVVLPPSLTRHLPLISSPDNSKWAIYQVPATPPDATPDAPPQQTLLVPTTTPATTLSRTRNHADSQAQFMHDVVYPNIEKYRKSDASLQILDANNQPLQNVNYTITQTRQLFDFGCSLPFFTAQPRDKHNVTDFVPDPVDPRELAHFTDLFNASQIAFSGKWLWLEPIQGQVDYSDLDAYVNWCTQNNVKMEFHFLSGYAPDWLTALPADQQGALFLQHSKDLVQRYGDKIPYWQVVNEGHLMKYAPAVIKQIRLTNPNLQLGISDCARFYTNIPSYPYLELLRGLPEVKWLKDQGAPVDYFAFHGHRPMGLWADVQEMYYALDQFAAQNVKIHISEFTVPTNTPIVGPIKGGQSWTPELQLEWYKTYYTVCFSHPAVQMINLWGMGPHTWQEGSGLLDDNYDPKPVYNALQSLIRHDWMTNLQGALDNNPISFRGFQGQYEIHLHLPNGQEASAPFNVNPNQPNAYTLHLAPDNTLQISQP